ncbi:hypothetical protein J4479_04415 [Candidatus Woesearchaeota archaeon]|nr:hypothetical protein [Candidatus Woesearchaeota archaeon]
MGKTITVEQILELGELGFNILKQFRRFIARYIRPESAGLPELVQKQLGAICAAYALAKDDQETPILLPEPRQRLLKEKEVLNAIISLKQLARQIPELQPRIEMIIGYLEKMT